MTLWEENFFIVLLNCWTAGRLTLSGQTKWLGWRLAEGVCPRAQLVRAPGLLTYEKVAKCTSASSLQPALQAARRSIPKVAVLKKKTARALPRKTLTSQLQGKIPCQNYSSEQKVKLKTNKSQEAGHCPHKSAQPSCWLPTSDFCNYELAMYVFPLIKTRGPHPWLSE